MKGMSMWAWIGQRVSAIFALALVVFHYIDPINERVQTLLIAFVIFHALLGLRVILLDIGLGKNGIGKTARRTTRP
jgi:succinate dehydrogenase / fumarate reductase cytochrome b subunit